MQLLIASLVIGIVATAIFDLWGIIINRLMGLPRPRWDMAGRWFGHMAYGRFAHRSMTEAHPVAGESAIGWILHYMIGVIYAALIPLIWGMEWLQAPTLLPALVVGIVTVGVGWFIMSPGMGNGMAASHAANPWKVRGLQLAAHAVFGFGLWIGAILYSL